MADLFKHYNTPSRSPMTPQKNIQTTQIYAKVLAKNVDDAFDALMDNALYFMYNARMLK